MAGNIKTALSLFTDTDMLQKKPNLQVWMKQLKQCISVASLHSVDSQTLYFTVYYCSTKFVFAVNIQ